MQFQPYSQLPQYLADDKFACRVDFVRIGRAAVRGDGTDQCRRVTAVFTVYAVESYSKDAFPTHQVYGDTGKRAELRLITCGGDFNEATQHYESNIVVYARLTATPKLGGTPQGS